MTGSLPTPTNPITPRIMLKIAMTVLLKIITIPRYPHRKWSTCYPNEHYKS